MKNYLYLGIAIVGVLSVLYIIENKKQSDAPPLKNDYSARGNVWTQSNQSHKSHGNYYSGSSDEGEETEEDEEIGYSDGTHSATVDYYNPNTGHTATYSIDVEVEDGEVRQLNWPNGGWSDEDHITPSELDEDGSTHIDGEDGKTYDVQIDDQ